MDISASTPRICAVSVGTNEAALINRFRHSWIALPPTGQDGTGLGL